jgi:hypothetical protein
MDSTFLDRKLVTRVNDFVDDVSDKPEAVSLVMSRYN